MASHKLDTPRDGKAWADVINKLPPIPPPTIDQILAPTYSGRAGEPL